MLRSEWSGVELGVWSEFEKLVDMDVGGFVFHPVGGGKCENDWCYFEL